MLEIQKRIGYTFKNARLLETALTHPSFAGDHKVESYQRLEFLGDAVLELCVSEALYKAHASLPEGVLTRMRAELVCEDALSKAAVKLGLDKGLRLSVGEERSGGRQKKSILCDVMESVIGAVHLDGGREEANRLIYLAIGDSIKNGSEKTDHLDAKSKLQAVLQARGEMPEYELVSQVGPAHKPVFVYRVMVKGQVIGEGEGFSKQLAQTEAAKIALQKMGK